VTLVLLFGRYMLKYCQEEQFPKNQSSSCSERFCYCCYDCRRDLTQKKLSYLQVIFLIIKLKAEIEKIVKELADYNVTLTFATIPPVLLSKFLPICVLRKQRI
jgi:hypothetical protein